MGNKNSGGRRRPNVVQLLRGVTRKDRLNPREPKPPDGPVVKPEGLSPGGSLAWDRLAPLALAMQTLTTADVPAFTTLCELQATLDAACAVKMEPGFGVVSIMYAMDREGKAYVTGEKIHPAIKLEGETAAKIRAYYDYFGLTPSGRARLQVGQAQEAAPSKWEGALG